MAECLDMADSIKVIDEDYVRRIHSRNPSGHIHKGHGIVAANASIPTKFQTIVTDNSDKKGFLCRAKRFQSDSNITEAPGPGSYVRHNKVDNLSTSFSKKGTGGFASKSKRGLKYHLSSAPGPGLYALQSTLVTKKDFNKAPTSSVFHKPIAQKISKLNGIPAPNSYNVLKYNPGKVNNVSADSAFKSQSKRDILNTKEAAALPAPWQYQVKDDLLHGSPKAPVSSFRSRTMRQMQADPPAVPGPGAYFSSGDREQINKQLFPKKHYLCISAPAMPLPPAPPSPGPGSYEMVDYEGPPKHYMSTSAFVSASNRWAGDANMLTVDLPGPAHYRPLTVGKQSFIYNSAGKWI
ncbi:O(6)-methylguanine-induced apoptosis 2-like [Haliotis rubra]|uniref:O(6)-methylguanine-induced apoptosis 2-like n=1 Tax=Haliotis rubra TaxID=36100 RepID=UPI001EE57B46|nr:O(6)-methylguanine-induced apoptosis 2-like [Haliotis rubra]